MIGEDGGGGGIRVLSTGEQNSLVGEMITILSFHRSIVVTDI
jgi:hypothetical protein